MCFVGPVRSNRGQATARILIGVSSDGDWGVQMKYNCNCKIKYRRQEGKSAKVKVKNQGESKSISEAHSERRLADHQSPPLICQTFPLFLPYKPGSHSTCQHVTLSTPKSLPVITALVVLFFRASCAVFRPLNLCIRCRDGYCCRIWAVGTRLAVLRPSHADLLADKAAL